MEKNLENQAQQGGFVNPAFQDISNGITAYMPYVMFYSIIGSYLVTASLNAFYMALPIALKVAGALFLQLIRFAVTFNDFINPTGRRSPWPPVVAGVLTCLALYELHFAITDANYSEARYMSSYLFCAALILGSYLVEMVFISKCAEAFKLGKAYSRPKGAVEKQTTTTTPPPFAQTAREAYNQYMALAEQETRHALEANQLPNKPARKVNPVDLQNRVATASINTENGDNDFLELSPVNTKNGQPY
jgi:hypothetical protein